MQTETTPISYNQAISAKIKKTSMTKIIVRKFFENKLAVLGLIVLLVIVISAILAPVIAPYDPAEQNLLDKLKPPSGQYLLGTDEIGRDIFTRLLYGGRVSLAVGFFSILGSITIGTIYGAISGYYGGRVDNLMMRVIDILISFPSIFLLITVVTLVKPSVTNIIIVFALTGWFGTSRLVRGEFLSLKNRDYVLAARNVGMSDARIIFRHMLPNAMAPIIVAATLGVGGVIIAESSISFLGLGISPPTASWGNMLQGAQGITIMLKAWWYPVFPGLMILLTVLSINFVGDGLRDALDPKLD